MHVEQLAADTKLRSDAGIALGPILFIIAILAILAAAIAAGSGSFNSSTNAEGNKAKASAIIQLGDNLKVGMDRLTMENGINYNGWTTDPTKTSNNNDLFSPIGGGIGTPSTSMAGDPATDKWYYPQGAIPGLGTWNSGAGVANTVQLAVLNVSKGVCQEINNRANGQNNVPAINNLGNFATNASAGDISTTMSPAWPVGSVNLYGKPVGCVYNNGGPVTNGYYFYEVLYVQ